MNEAAAQGRVIRALFPRMSGKLRPGVVAHIVSPSFIVATPMSSMRANQAGRVPFSQDEALGVEKDCWLLAPMTAIIRSDRIEEWRGPAKPSVCAALELELSAYFGADWRSAHPQLRRSTPKPQRLNPLFKRKRSQAKG